MKKRNQLNAIIGAHFKRSGRVALTPEQLNGKGVMMRAMSVSSFNKEARTVELAFSSEYEGKRWFGIEILDHSPSSIQLDRLRDAAALLVDHDWRDQVGVVESVTIGADRVGRAVVRFGNSARANEIFQDVMDGIRKHVSVGYHVLAAKLEETREGDVDVYRITSWEPYEISIVPVPFDHTVGVGRSAENPQEDGTPPQVENSPVSTQGARAVTTPVQPKEPKTMNEKILRNAAGHLVRALVDENGVITKELEVIERAGDAERNALATGARTEQTRVRSLTEMGDKFASGVPGAPELARKAIVNGDTPEQLQAAMLAAVQERASRPLSEQGEAAAIGLSDKEVRNFSFMKAIRALMPNATKADKEGAAFELECSAAAQRAYGKAAQGILIPNEVLTRAFNAGGAANTPAGASTGGVLVQNHTMSGSFIEMLRNRTTIMRMATVLGGMVGTFDIPKQTGGATGYWIGEGEDAGEGSPSIGQISFTSKTVAAYTDITRKLIMQATPDAEGITRRDIVNALGLSIDLAGFYGTGTDKMPRGIANYNGINAVPFATSGAPTFAELVQMETEVAADNADIGQMGYIGNARFRGHAKTAVKFASAGSATIWEPGNTVNGYRTEITNQVNNGDVFFGNFADLIIAMWGGLDLTVDHSSLSKSGGVRIVAFQDVDMNLRRNESMCVGRAA